MPPRPKLPPPINKALLLILMDSEGLVPLNEALSGPYFLGGGSFGGVP